MIKNIHSILIRSCQKRCAYTISLTYIAHALGIIFSHQQRNNFTFIFSVFKPLRKLTTLNPREVAEQLLEKALFPQSHRRLLRKLRECTNFCEDFHERFGCAGAKLVENFSKRSETDLKLCIWLTYFGPDWSKIWESLPPWKSFAFTIYYGRV